MGFLLLDGTNDNHAHAPDIGAYDLTDIDLIVCVALADYTPATNQFLVAQTDGGGPNGGYAMFLRNDGGSLRLQTTDGIGLTNTDSTVQVPTVVGGGDPIWLRVTCDVDDGAADSQTEFWYSLQAPSTAVGDVIWVQLGATVANGSTRTVAASARKMSVGAQPNGTNASTGEFYKARVLDGIGGTVVFDPDFTDLTVGEITGASFVEDSAQTATVTLAGAAWLYSGLVAVTGTAATAPTLESEIVTGAHTIVLTLTGDTWVATAGDDNGITDALIAGIDSDGVEVGGWDAVVRANMVFGDVTRLNDTTIQIILGDEPTYAIDADETITITVPATALTADGAVVATPTFDITAENPVATRRVISSPRYGITRVARR